MDKLFNRISTIMNFDILHYKELTGGVTNTTYLLNTNMGVFVLRESGLNTLEYIDRESEIYNLKIISKQNFVPHIYYMTKDIILMEYLPSHIELNKETLKDSILLEKIVSLLIKLHTSQLKFNREFDLFKNIQLYKTQLLHMNVNLPEELSNNEKKLFNFLNELYNNYPKQLVPCHIDPKLNNFIVSNNKLYLIDWEYSNMADTYFELANFTLTNELNEREEEIFLNKYFTLSNQNYDKQKYILYKIVTDYLWIYWHLIKLHQNENVAYNQRKWKERLNRSLLNCKKMEGIG